jgi:hypothetical protein
VNPIERNEHLIEISGRQSFPSVPDVRCSKAAQAAAGSSRRVSGMDGCKSSSPLEVPELTTTLIGRRRSATPAAVQIGSAVSRCSTDAIDANSANWFVATRLRAHVEKSISLELIPKSAVA